MQSPSEKLTFGARLRHLWDEGLARHVVVAQDERRVLDLPLTIIVVATVLAPWLVGIGAVIALLTAHHIRLERHEDAPVGRAAATEPAPPAPPQPSDSSDPLP